MLHRFTSLLTYTLLVASFMWASEGAIDGDGLHLAVLWIVAGTLSLFVSNPRDDTSTPPETGGRLPFPNPPMMAASGFLLLVTGIWISTWHVFGVHGDRRAALNLAFHWTAALAAFIAVRRVCADFHHRNSFALLLAGLCFGASLQGVLQHHVIYRKQADWYSGLRSQLDDAQKAGGLAAAVQTHQMQEKLGAHGVPLRGASRQLFESRLLGSSEPIGPFALANTLAGFLAVALVLLVGSVISPRAADGKAQVLRTLPVLLVIGYCLVLTKSRTAWVGTTAGVGWLALSGHRAAGIPWKMVARFCLAAAALLGLGIAGGAIDREVVTESLRSLLFRWHYWTGAAGVIRDSPLMGAGPGNFRQAYLVHKPLQSSEEILDPHNVLLDAWCSAGLIGLAGVLLIAAGLCCRAFRQEDVTSTENSGQSGPIRRTATISIALALAIHCLYRWIGGGPLIDVSLSRLWISEDVVWLVPLGALLAIQITAQSFSCSRRAVAVAASALFIHLLAAGGLQIAAVQVVMAILLALFVSPAHVRTALAPDLKPPTLRTLIPRTITAAVMAVSGVAAVMYGLQPISAAARQQVIATVRESSGDIAGAMTAAAAGIRQDPWNVGLRQRLCGLQAYQIMQLAAVPVNSRDDFEEDELKQLFSALESNLEELIDTDVQRWQSYKMRSEVHQTAAAAHVPGASLRQAADDLQQTLELYPSNVSLWVAQAELSASLDQPENARQAACQALEIEELNSIWGHVERRLSVEDLAHMKMLCNASE